jgi:hypothetical protein
VSGDVVRVLDTSPAARAVAAELGLELVSPLGVSSDEPVLAVIADASQVAGLPQLRAGHNVLALVAWNLAEGDVLRLLDGDVPVFIGQPTPQELRALVWWGESPVSSGDERELAARLAILEDAFEG